VDIVAAGDTVAAHTWAVVDIVVAVPAGHIAAAVDIAVVVLAGCMEPAHTGLDMAAVALDIVQIALHLPGS
jgi:hypothetical protein